MSKSLHHSSLAARSRTIGVYCWCLVAFLCISSLGNAQLNENCTISILNRTTQANADGSWIINNVPAGFGLVRARATCVQNGITQFGQSDLFQINANQLTGFNAQIVLGSTTPIPTSLAVTAPTSNLTIVGQTLQLGTMASFADGTVKDVTAAATGTQYTVSNPSIATVSADGFVTAVSSGTVVIQAVNEGRQGIATIQVLIAGASHGGIPDSWAIAHGLDPNDPAMPFEDPDHDGLTNLQEFQNGTDPNNPDTDGDGLTDGQEVLMYHTSPVLYSTDGTGISDGIEVQTGTLGASLPAKLAAALKSLEVKPSNFVLNVNTIQGLASQQLQVLGHLIDGKTILDLTSTQEETNYSSSDLTICNFGAPDGNVFAGNNGSCTITATNNGFTAQATGIVNTFSPTALSFVSIPGYANGVAVNGNFAYVAAGSAGLQVVDVTNRFQPTIAGSLPLPGNGDDVTILGNLAYVAADSAGLEVIDVSSPLAPVLVGSFRTPGIAWSVKVRGSTAYVAAGASGLQIIDVTNPVQPALLGSLSLPGTSKGLDADLSRNLVVVVGDQGLFTVNVSNPISPTLIGSLNYGGSPQNVALSGNFAFVADSSTSLTSVDITNPAAPVLGTSTDPNLGGELYEVALSNGFALGGAINFINTGVTITDISNPPSLISRAILFFTPNATNGFRTFDKGTAIAADGSYVYLTTDQTNGSAQQPRNGVTDDSRLYIGQYLAPVDNKGIPPTAAITSPLNGITVIAGSILPITVNATDDVAVSAVNFLLNGQLVFTSTSAPYQFSATVPTGVSSLTIGATAIDFGANVGTAQTVTVNVIPDPGTTVTGIVVDSSQNPVAGATVTTLGGLSATTQNDGSFTISNVSTVLGNIVVSATGTVNGIAVRGSSAAVPPVRGGTTNAGTIVVSQAVFETNFGTLLSKCDDCFFQQTLPFPFTFFGQTYNSVFVNNNGNLTFSFGDSTFTPTVDFFPSQPRISPFWDDLISGSIFGFPAPSNEGLYVNDTIPGEFVVTWLHQQIYCCVGDDTIQAILFPDGRIQFAYNGITTIAIFDSTSDGAIVGITPGGNVPLTQVDYVSTPSFTTTSPTSILEEFTNSSNPLNLDGAFIVFTPNASGGYNVQTIPPPPATASAPQSAAAVSRPRAAASTQTGGATIQGTAFDSQGNPLSGVEIDVTSSRALSYKGVTTTDQNGHYSIAGVPTGGISVVALKDGATVGVGAAVVQATGATIDLHALTNLPKATH